MTNALRAEEYILPESNVIELDGLRGPIETPSAVLANPDELAPKKSRKRKAKKATGKKRGRPATPKAPVEPETPPAALTQSLYRVAPAGDGIVSRVPKLHPDDWRMIACVVGLAAAVASIALVIWW